jgi:hypothetical protein
MRKPYIINDKNAWLLAAEKGHSRGLIPRDFKRYPIGYHPNAKPFDIPLIPQDEWEDRLRARIADKAQLSDVRNRGKFGEVMPSTDQDGYGYCWAHSSTSAILICRALDNQPYVDLSAFSVAAPIKNYRNEGGWGSQSLEWIAEKGIASSEFWPQRACDRQYDTPEMRDNAKLHRFTEWLDLETKEQFITCLLLGMPVVSDFNWWGHSVCTLDLVSIEPFQTRIWNSWGDKWGENGTGILEGKKAVPNGMLAARVATASNV